MAKKRDARRTPEDRMLPADKKKLTCMLLRFLDIAGAERIGVWKNEGQCTTYEYNLDTPLGPSRFVSLPTRTTFTAGLTTCPGPSR